MHCTRLIDRSDEQLQYMMNEFCDQGRWLLEDLGERGVLMLYALTDNKKKFEQVWTKILDDRVDSED